MYKAFGPTEASVDQEQFRLTVYYDEIPESPREWDNVGTLWIYSRNYDVGDRKFSSKQAVVEAIAEEVLDRINISAQSPLYPEIERILANEFGLDTVIGCLAEQGAWTIPLRLYDYGSNGLQLRENCEYPDGLIFVTEEKIEEEGIDKDRVTDILRSEIKAMNHYLSGNVLCYMLETVNVCEKCGSEIIELEDSCCGIYADSLDDLKKELKSMLGEKFYPLVDGLSY